MEPVFGIDDYQNCPYLCRGAVWSGNIMFNNLIMADTFSGAQGKAVSTVENLHLAL